MVAIPGHVPAELVREFDYLDAPTDRDLWAWWAEQNNGPDIFYTPSNGGHWVLTRHADIAAVLSNFDDFSSRTQTVPKPTKSIPLAPIEYDPPIHTDFRRLISKFFEPKAIRALELKAQALTIELIEGFMHKGACDFAKDYALFMPIGIFMSIVDLPDSDRVFLVACVEDIVRGSQDVQMGGFQRVFEYLAVKFAERRANLGTDMLSAVIQGEVDGGRPMTDAELLGMGALLLVGGLDTVAAMMGFIAIYLAENADDRRRLVDNPALIPTAVEELIRRFQIANIAREVNRDLVLNGVQMKAGDKILTPTSMASVDDREYPDPMKVDFDRKVKRSLVFGAGPHQCVGQFLARIELRVFLVEWLKRIPEFRIDPSQRPVIVSGRANSVHSLPLIWGVLPS